MPTAELELQDIDRGKSSTSLATSSSPPGLSQACTVKQCVVGGEGLANFGLDHVFLESQLCVTCELVECQLELKTSCVSWVRIQVGKVSSSIAFWTLSPG